MGWAIGEQMTAELVLAALNMALQQRKPGGVIHHSDQPVHPYRLRRAGQEDGRAPVDGHRRQCLRQLDVEPSSVAFVRDDFEADMQPALELGMQAIWKSTVRSPRVACSSDSLHEIRAFLLPAE